ncbi:signal recognition particle-docking protein FtsY [Methylorubrum sp. SL192]|uniref:signal recognition particle-docking protein FtsY n=1 Tax=Methylorubrum sp. SL192 TaxID=2995167 RepID=UPI0015FC2480|nr:signal recognition particle-docking protein FtsY [Methylorubrum sp. SL192]MBA9066811.1 fused signal recognition particle receptor [Methylobacterium sp. RAS18]MCY1642400.1 signal recognition particle-docking protein FtsY [Methylorubrum sp. SL192]
MSDDEKPGWFGRLFGRKGAPESKSPEPVPAEDAAAEETPAGESATPDPLSPASASEGQPVFTTAADDVAHVPPAVSEPAPDDPDKNRIPDELEGADLQPEPQPPSGEAPQPDEISAESEPAPAPTETAEKRNWWSRLTGSEEETPAPAAESEPPVEVDIQPVDSAAALASDAVSGAVEGSEKQGWWSRLTAGMRRTSSALSDRVTGLFTKRKLDATTLEDLEDALIQADFGVETATRMSEAVGKGRYEKGISPDEVRAILATEIERALEPVALPIEIDSAKKPYVILTVGVNGAGKTTTIGKLSLKFKAEGRSVMLAAGDTFRAAAIEQLRVWGDRTGTPVISRAQGSDAAGLAFDAFKEARENGTDVLLIDTAGRLQNKAGLMAELEKIVRVIRKLDPEAPHATLLVLDATVGQNALSQVELFSQAAPVSGLVMTKLDGTARGGILVALATKFGLPVHFIGVGEGVEDLEPFAARDFARAITGLPKE